MKLIMKIEAINSQKDSAKAEGALTQGTGKEAGTIHSMGEKQREMEIQKQFEQLLEEEVQFLR
jgi:hypothetical protein